MNNKGLVSHDRQTRKDAFYYYKAMWSKEPVLHITSKRYAERLNESVTIKVYSNQSSVSLSVNGNFVGKVEPINCIAVFEGVSLLKGENKIIAKAMHLEDHASFKHVEELSVSYECPEGSNTMMGNWFGPDVVLDDHVKAIE